MEVRATPIIDVQLGVDPITTRFVKGQGQVDRLVGPLLFPDATVPAWQFKYIQYGHEIMQKHLGVERGMRAEIRHADFEVQTLTDKLVRYSFATLRDVDEIGNAVPQYNLRGQAAAFAREIVNLEIERVKRDLADATASYAASHVITIGAGDEWNDATPGDSFVDISAACDLITAATGVRKGLLSVFLPDSSYRAVEEEVKFRDHLFANGIRGTSAEVVATYWGVREVIVANPIEMQDDDTPAPLYGDNAYVWFRGNPGPGQTLDAVSARRLVWGGTATYNGGVANTPFLDQKTTSWWFPWTDYAKPLILNTGSAAKIINTNANV
jgi:hypothetical protein